MTATTVRVLSESDWQLYRAVSLRALEESATSPTAKRDDAQLGEQSWRDRVIASVRLLAEREGRTEGIASLAASADDSDDPADDSATGEIFGLYVVPEERSTGVSWRLTEAAVALATRQGCRQLLYWVGVDNARAIAFAKNFGFRSTGHRRTSRVEDSGDQEMAMVLSLVGDDTSVPNPTRRRPISHHGPTE